MPLPLNSITATRNGAAWKIENATVKIKGDSLLIADTNVTASYSEILKFNFDFIGAGNVTLSGNNVTYEYLTGMDNPYVPFQLDNSYNNVFKITDYDVNSGIIVGTFDFRLLKNPSNSDSRYPGIINFSNASFRLYLSK